VKKLISDLKCPNSCHANWMMASLVKGSRLATLAPKGGGPLVLKFGANLSNPWPKDPYRKNSASRYSKFKGNSRRSVSDCGTGESLDFSVMSGDE